MAVRGHGYGTRNGAAMLARFLRARRLPGSPVGRDPARGLRVS
jgi:hypothetical protein